MIYGINKVLRSSDSFVRVPSSTDYPEDTEPSATPETWEGTPSESETEGDELRAVYDSDISDSVLAKLSAHYNAHAGPFDRYLIYRSSQYTYHLIYGATSNYLNWSSAFDFVYTTPSNYNGVCTFVESRSGSFSVSSSDISGSTGYLYSSNMDYPASRYVDSNRVTPLLLIVFFVCAIGAILFRWLHHVLYGRR